MQLILISCLMFVSGLSFAGENIVGHKSPEALGRGNSMISWSNSNSTNIFQNPAFLSESQKFSFDLIDLTLDFSQNLIPLLSNIPQKNNEQIYNQIKPYFGNSYSAQGFLSPVVSYKGFSLIPLFVSGMGSATIRNPVFSNADAFYYYDIGTSFAKGFSVNDKLSFGISSVFTQRKGVLESANLNNGLKLPLADKREGNSISFNFGTTYQFKDKSETVAGFSWTNIGSPHFWNNTSGRIAEDSISKLYEEIGFGFSTLFFPINYFSKKVKWAMEVHNLFDSNYDTVDKLSFGTQYDMLSWLNIKGGIYESSPTYGISLDTRIATLDLSSYKENSRTGYQSKNRHYLLGFKLGFH